MNDQTLGYLIAFLGQYLDVLTGERAREPREYEQMREELEGISEEFYGRDSD